MLIIAIIPATVLMKLLNIMVLTEDVGQRLPVITLLDVGTPFIEIVDEPLCGCGDLVLPHRCRLPC